MKFKINQIVKGQVAGTFRVIGFTTNSIGEVMVRIKEVHPTELYDGPFPPFALPEDALKALE